MDVREKYLAAGTGCRSGRAEFVVVPTFEEFSGVAGVMSVEMRRHRVAVAARRRLMVMMMVAVMELRLLLRSQHLSVVLRRWRTKFDPHASGQVTVHKSIYHRCGFLVHSPQLLRFVL